jgi:hypothetical protein
VRARNPLHDATNKFESKEPFARGVRSQLGVFLLAP